MLANSVLVILKQLFKVNFELIPPSLFYRSLFTFLNSANALDDVSVYCDCLVNDGRMW